MIKIIKHKAYRFRLYPNKAQQVIFAKTFGCVRFIYNKSNTPAQYKFEFEWLNEVDSLALANAQLNLQRAFKNCFQNKSTGFPKFKSKKRGNKPYTTNNQNNSIRIAEGKYVRLPKIGLVRIKLHRQIPQISNRIANDYDVVCIEDLEMKAMARSLNLGKSVMDNGWGMCKLSYHPR